MKKVRKVSATIQARKEVRQLWENENLSMSALVRWMAGTGKKSVVNALDAMEQTKGKEARVSFARACSVKNICAALTEKDEQAKKDGKSRFYMTTKCPITDKQVKREKFSISMMFVAINQMSANQIQSAKELKKETTNKPKGKKAKAKA